jgi:carboxypeptidase family protein/TonB-dependent receptor-like protein
VRYASSRIAATLIIVLTAFRPPAAAQNPTATVRGVVIDQTDARLPGAHLTITREETNETRRTVSDEAGRFAFAELPSGRYIVQAELPGFSVFRQRAQLAVGSELWVDVRLAVTTTALVTTGVGEAPVPVIDRGPAMRTLIDQQQVTNLPLDGRNFLELALLVPGTVPAPQGSASSVRGDFAFSVNGAREDFNNYILDGVYNVDPKLGTPAVRPPVDAIQEFEVVTANYDASFGRSGSGQVNVLTRSGANRISGTAYEFLRNGALDARNHFAPDGEPAPDYGRHQFGGSVGGPIARNRTFFFADYEGTRLREGITRVTNVPTAAERAGDFSQSLFPRPVDPLSRQPLPGGRLPSFFIHPAGAALAALYPAPNRNTPFANFVSSPTLRDDVDQFDVKLEHVLSASRAAGRYSFSDRRLLEPFAGPAFSALPGFGNDVDRRGQNVLFSVTQATSSLVNDVRVGYNRVAIGVFPENPQIDNASVGLQTLASNPRDAGLSLISVAGYSPLGHEYNNPQESTATTLQIADTATWARGAHLLKFGGEWYGVRQTAFRDVQARGFLSFIQQAFTGNALADLLLGLPVVTGGARLDNPQNLRARNWSLFAHDEWRSTDSLTLSAGIRYDYLAPPVDRDDRANLYDLSQGTVVQVGTSGMPRGGYHPDRNNLAPRGGFAWSLNDGASVVRGGYGVYFNQGALATSEGLYFNPPYFNLSVNIASTTLTNPFPANPGFFPQSATAYERDLQTPWMEQWNVGVQQQLGRTRMFEVSYVGSRGHDLISARDANQPAPSTRIPNLRPNPLFADVTLIESRGSSRYNAMQIKFQQRPEMGVSVVAAYTYGKSTDNASGFFTSAGDPNFPQNSLDPGAEEGRSSFDVRHRITASFSYLLPFGGNFWLENWQVHGVATLNSGRPFTVALHPDIDQSNTGRSNLGFGNNDRPNVSGNPSLPVGERSEDQWFNTAAFTMPPFGSFGNAARNIVEGPGYRSLNVGITKLLPMREARLQLRVEVFNLFNRANFDLPDAFLGSPTFGRILSAGSPRRVQFGVKALF